MPRCYPGTQPLQLAGKPAGTTLSLANWPSEPEATSGYAYPEMPHTIEKVIAKAAAAALTRWNLPETALTRMNGRDERPVAAITLYAERVSIKSAAFSAIITVAASVLADGTCGITEASTTRKFRVP
jgi:hypothetical protein